LLKSHGCVTVGDDLEEAVVLALYLEENARRQCLAAPLGDPYVLSDEEVATFRKSLRKPHLFRKAWDYHMAKGR
jgi:L-fuculose-phosphate aldolase